MTHLKFFHSILKAVEHRLENTDRVFLKKTEQLWDENKGKGQLRGTQESYELKNE